MRRAAKVDRNQGEIVRALRSVGASVAITSAVGGGFPDLVVGYRGRNFLIEIKDGEKVPSARRLTGAQERFVGAWRGEWSKADTADEALEAIGAVRQKKPEATS